MAGYSPGWNDPPPLTYSQTSQPGGKRNLLNKRVPFQLDKSTPSPVKSSEKCSTEILDSASPPFSPIPNVDNNLSNDSPQKEITDKSSVSIPVEEILPFVISTFESILLKNSERYEKKRIDEINLRLKIMKDSWDSKISIPVKNKMLVLAQELSKGNADAALKIQCALMVDYLREVKQWMVGIKHIIEMERQVSLDNIPSEIPN